MFQKKGQSAVEYLVTYGWALIAIIATVSVLGYFGLLNPARYIPDSCEFGEQLKCVDHFIDDTPQILLRFRNNFEAPITITNVYGNDIIYLSGPVDIAQGEIRRLTIDVNPAREIFEGQKETFDLIVEFQRDDGTGTTPLHNVSGRIFAEVQDNDLGLVS